MKIKTELLQNMVAKAIQGAGNNKMIPLTSLLGIEVKGDKLTLMTTDGSNQLRINEKIEYDPLYGPQEFYTIVNADTFAKLIGKTTKEFIELQNNDNYLQITGNGSYKLEIAINEEGQLVKFPDIKNIQGDELTLNLSHLQEDIRTAKASVAKTMEIPCLTGYYIGKNTISTDRQLICSIINQDLSTPLLISSEMAELLLLIDEAELLEIVKKDNELIFYTNKYVIYGKELEGKENYPVQAIETLLQKTYDNTIKVNKQELLDVLDRMSLFVSDYDKGGIFIEFTPDGLIITSQKSNAKEVIVFPGTNQVNVFTCLIDIEMLKSQVETISSEVVEISYGQDRSIKLVDGNCTHIISLLEKSE